MFVILIAILVFRPSGLLGIAHEGESMNRSPRRKRPPMELVLPGAAAGLSAAGLSGKRAVPLDRDFDRHATDLHLHLRDPGAGLERRGRLHRPAALGHRGVFRHRGLHHRHSDRAGLSVSDRVSGGAGALDRRRGAGWACCSARRRCGCAAIIWRSSRWASAK